MPNENPSVAIVDKDKIAPPDKPKGWAAVMPEFTRSMDSFIESREQQFKTDLANFEASQARASKVAKEEHDKQVEAFGRIEESAKGLGAPPTPQALPRVPPVPKSVNPRSFLQIKGDDLFAGLNSMILGLSMLAASGSAGKHPTFALSAFASAVKGWTAGDMVRVKNEWARYAAEVDAAKNEQKRIMDETNEMWREYGAHKDLISLQLQMFSARSKMSDKMVELAGRDPLQWQARLNFDSRQMEQAYNKAMQYSIAIMHSAQFQATLDQRQRIADDNRAVRVQEFNSRSQEMKQRFQASSPVQKMISGYMGVDTMLQKLQHIKDALPLLSRHGLIPGGAATFIDKKTAQLAYQNLFFRNDVSDEEKQKIALAFQDLQRWGTSALLGTELAIQGGVVGAMRIRSIAEAEAGDVTSLPLAFWQQFLSDAVPVLTAKKKVLGDTMNRAQIPIPSYDMTLGESRPNPNF